MGYARSPFRDFENYLRIVVVSDEDDIQLILKQYNSNFVTYELSPGIYTVKNSSQAVYTMGHHEGTLQIEYDDRRKKRKLILTHLGSTFGTLSFDEQTLSELYWILHNFGIISLLTQFMLIVKMHILVKKLQI